MNKAEVLLAELALQMLATSDVNGTIQGSDRFGCMWLSDDPDCLWQRIVSHFGGEVRIRLMSISNES